MVDLTKKMSGVEFSVSEEDKEKALNNFMNFLQGPKFGGQATPVEVPLRREEPEQNVPVLNEALPQPTEQLPEVATPAMSNPVQQPRLETSKLTQVLQSLRGKLNPDLSIYDKMQKDLESARNQNLEDLKNARLQDSNANMYSGINAGINQISQGLANRAGYTDIKTNPFKYDANKAEQVGTDNKSKLDALMERYKLASDKEKVKLDNEMRKANLDVEIAKAEDANTVRRELAKQKAIEDSKNSEESKLKLEEKKNDLRIDKEIQKENRKIRQTAETALGGIDERIDKIKQARALLKEMQGSFSDTGLIDQYITGSTRKGQQLENLFNSLALNEMVTMFQGMSKAVDSDAERAFFASTQPNLGRYSDTNIQILNDLEKKLTGLKGKTQKAISMYDRRGAFAEEEPTSTNRSSAYTSQKSEESSDTVTVLDPNGKPKVIPKSKLSAALKAGGRLP